MLATQVFCSPLPASMEAVNKSTLSNFDHLALPDVFAPLLSVPILFDFFLTHFAENVG